jgi:hypothetical protein
MKTGSISTFLLLLLSFTLMKCDPPEGKVKEATLPDSTMLGLIDDTGVLLVLQNCNACHSTQLISQNRMTKAGWKSTIRWMQATQNLWDLGEDEDIVLTYLAKNYGPNAIGRRQSLVVEQWYPLDEEN